MEIVSRREVEHEEEFCWIEEGAGDELHSRMETALGALYLDLDNMRQMCWARRRENPLL